MPTEAVLSPKIFWICNRSNVITSKQSNVATTLILRNDNIAIDHIRAADLEK